MSKNKYINPENYFEGYNASIKENSKNPEAVKLDKLCYMTFVETVHGAEFLKYADEMFLMPELCSIASPNYNTAVTYFEGFKQAFRMIHQNIKSHKQRIDAEAK